MKLKLIDRMLLCVCAVVVLLSGVAVVVMSLQTGSYSLDAEGEGFFTLRRVAVLLVGVLLFIVGGYLAYLPHKVRRDRKGFIIRQTDNGELRIAIKAIDSLIKKCVDMHEEIRLISMDVTNTREGVTIDLGISLANNISIPLAVASLQRQIKQYLLASSGIDVCEVRVLVETAENGVGESPYLVNNDIPAAGAPVAEEQPKAKIKLPLHRRIFGKAEQAVTMPETPVPEAPIPEAPIPEAPPAQEEAAVEEAAVEEVSEPAAQTEEKAVESTDNEEGADHEQST